MCFTCFKLLALKNQDWLHVCLDVFWCLEFIRAFEVFDSHFEHVENMTVKNTPKHQVVRSLFLMIANHEQTAVILHRLVFNQTWVFHRNDIVSVTYKHLHPLSSFHELDVFEKVVYGLARFTSLHDHASLGVLEKLRSSFFENLTTLMSRGFLLDAKLTS